MSALNVVSKTIISLFLLLILLDFVSYEFKWPYGPALWRRQWLALDHAHDNEVARAYDRGERFTQRVELFNWWGEQLAAAQRGAKVIPLKAA